MAGKRRVFMTIATKDGTPLRRATPIDPEKYEQDVQRLVDRGMRPPAPFPKRAAK